MATKRRPTQPSGPESQINALQAPDIIRDRILCGDALATLQTLPDGCVQTIVTSPPYFGLRDYGTAQWKGGDAMCDHAEVRGSTRGGPKSTITGGQDTTAHATQYRERCGKCGATRQDAQIGLEPTPDAYVANLVAVFREARRVLRDDGTLWLNLGDSYAAKADHGTNSLQTKSVGSHRFDKRYIAGLKPKDLIGIPWRVAFALQADGWYLRADCIWHKPNCMPESVRDRPTKSHEYVFLLTKSERYYYDADAVREPATYKETRNGRVGAYQNRAIYAIGNGTKPTGVATRNLNLRNKRSVWNVATAPYKGAHFAVMPPALVEPCVLAGTSPLCCETCGAPWQRVVEREETPRKARQGGVDDQIQARYRGMGNTSSLITGMVNVTRTTGWRPTCHCATNTGAGRAVVLDPFSGAGTVGVVAKRHSRHYLGIELNPDYIALAEARIANERQPVLWTVGTQAGSVAS